MRYCSYNPTSSVAQFCITKTFKTADPFISYHRESARVYAAAGSAKVKAHLPEKASGF